MTATAFPGWPDAAVEFYRGLEADNSKSFWTEHRAVYDAEVLAPMQALLADLTDEFGEAKIFRPNRDIRFSADKSPYKTSISAMLGNGYVEFSARGLGVGAGCHMMAADQLERMRAAIADDGSGAELVDILAGLEAADIEVMVRDRLKTAPRGYPKDHPRADLLRNKDLAAWKHWPADEPWMRTDEVPARIAEVLRTARPLVRWLDANVGDSTLERRR
ncbi:MAG TPA: DUF2461 domain-containing protein [Microbacterium sp.]|uniref:DUF2461 domain-containing protein n=1 Tax=Microbacterium sp. TaxID=51671 RepID=UPI002B462046|nr:DUF2461 domain-containing protein [Microbacterium sp.]HKT55200.1 DUF2461 domain-containing protein [Microbacterium sp.]